MFRGKINELTNVTYSVFDVVRDINFAPALLFSPRTWQMFAYVVIYRNLESKWVFSVRSHLSVTPDDKRHKFTIALFKAVEADEAERSAENVLVGREALYSFTGEIVPYFMSEAEVFESGQCLKLGDEQMKEMKYNTTLLVYTVQLHV